MAYNGYLIRIGGENLDNKYIKFNTYKITPNQRQDVDSYRDANGVLHRQVVEHTATKIEFNTVPMSNSTLSALMLFIRSKFSSASERKVSLSYYDMETDSYKTGNFYMPDIQYEIYGIKNKEVLYNSFRVAFIEY